MSSEKFDKKIQDAAEHHHPVYDEQAWEKMKKLLDKHLPEEKSDRRRFLWLWFLLLSLAVGGAYIGITKPWKGVSSTAVASQDNGQKAIGNGQKAIDNNGQQATNDRQQATVNSQASSTNNEQLATGNGKDLNERDQAASNDKQSTINNDQLKASDKNTVDKDQPVTIDQKQSANKQKTTNYKPTTNYTRTNNSKTSVVVNSSSKKQKINIVSNKAGKGKKKNTSNALADNNKEEEMVDKEIIIDNKEEKPAAKQNNNNPSPNKQEEIVVVEEKKDAVVVVDKKENITPAKEEKKDEVKTPIPSPKKKNNFKNAFAFTISTGPDVSAVSFDRIGKTRLVIGAGISYQLNKRWNLRTGFYAVQKVYDAKPDQYTPPDPNWYYYQYVQDIHASCRVFEIPLIASYTFSQRPKHSWFASAGVSSYIMKSESYDYFLKYPSGNTDTKNYTVYDKNEHFLSSLRLSMGYQKQFSNRISFSAEPYINTPLTGIGLGKIKLSSAGVLFTLSIKPFAKK